MDFKSLAKKLKIPQRKYLRPQLPSKTEKALGVVILLIVVGIGVTIYAVGRRTNQDLFRLDPKLLEKAKIQKKGWKLQVANVAKIGESP